MENRYNMDIYFLLKKIRSAVYCDACYMIVSEHWVDHQSVKLLGCITYILANTIVICTMLNLVIKLRSLFFIFRYTLTVSYFTFDVLGILFTLCMLSHLIL